jgi:hypothetical protein
MVRHKGYIRRFGCEGGEIGLGEPPIIAIVSRTNPRRRRQVQHTIDQLNTVWHGHSVASLAAPAHPRACVVYEKHLNFVAARQRFDFFPTNSSKLRKYWVEPTGEGYFRVTK